MKVYDDIENEWSPYLMLKKKNLITNDVFNTDKFIRYTDSFKKLRFLDDIDKKKTKNKSL